jgi:nuclear GTP-binding protein
MAKGKNHDRKANPSFGKTNGKANSSSAGGEFTLKRVKGKLFRTLVDPVQEKLT